ncbi:MAG: FAD-dependent oxidoreductase [Salinivenus sp.]
MAPRSTDVLVLGSGIAGLSAALGAARNGASVTVATKATRPEGASTWWAQGGIAVARTAPDAFKADIDAASSGTSDPDALDVLVRHADRAVRDVLIDTLEVGFDTGGDGAAYDYGREAAHSADRILHVDASTGRHIHVPFLDYLAEHDRVDIRDDTAALQLLRDGDAVVGALLESDGRRTPWRAGATVVATGGIGALYGRSTNPVGATGDGVAMAAHVGADVADLEFVQFHPTVCVESGDPFLVSEAVRGEGAVLRDAHGERFMPAVHEDAELAPRDVVARAVEAAHDRTGRVVLDVSPLDFDETFPDLAALCAEHGVDPSTGIPVVPAEHFLCGGIDVDTRGRASLDRLYAVGECARTGVHGANRLASTSLLEGLVWGLRAGTHAVTRRQPDAPTLTSPDRVPTADEALVSRGLQQVRRAMDEHVGLRRSAEGLRQAVEALRAVQAEVEARPAPLARPLAELRSAAAVGRRIARAALDNEHSVGCHYRTDMPAVEAPAGSNR